MLRSHLNILATLAFVVAPMAFFGCGDATPTPVLPAPKPAPPPAAVAAEAPEAVAEPMPELRTGALDPLDHTEPISAKIIARHVGDAYETLLLDVARPTYIDEDAPWRWWGPSIAVSVEGDGTQPYSFVSRSARAPTPISVPEGNFLVWIRRSRALAGKSITGHLFIPAEGNRPGHKQRFHVEPTSAPPPSDPTFESKWAFTLADTLRENSFSAFSSFASRRLEERFSPKKGASTAGASTSIGPQRQPMGDLSEIMGTTTGAASIQEALQTDRGLFLTVTKQKPTVPLARVKGVGLEQHPWAEMLKKLGTPPPAEPLSAMTPADFYYMRARGLVALLDLLDEMDALGTPGATVLNRRGEYRNIAARYEAELGLGRGPLTRALGPDVIEDLAVMGSDPYVNEGTDVTFLFRLKPNKKALFDAALASTLATHGSAHGGVSVSKTKIDGVDVTVVRSPDNAVRQHRASLGHVELVSNSPGAVKRILETVHKKRPPLAEELDLQYMLARDAKPGQSAGFDDIFIFLGDRFVSEVVGPRQKILEARRQLALAELQTPGFAALLYGLVHGQSPKSTNELIQSGLLQKDELKHANGGTMAFQPGQSATSSWGSPAALVPLIDLPEPTLVTDAEAKGYERFADTYRSYWSRYIDPIAIRIGLTPDQAGNTLTADVRILPIIEGSEYRDLLREVGKAKVDVASITSGARMVLAVGQNAEVRRDLGRLMREFTDQDRLKLDWLGDWAMIGVADESGLGRVLVDVWDDLPQKPMTEAERERRQDIDDFAVLSKLPLYAAVGIKSQAGVALSLVAARKLAEEAIPGMFTWGEHEVRRGIPIVRVAFRNRDSPRGRSRPGELTFFYAVAHDALYVALQEGIIQKLVDDAIDGKVPHRLSPDAPSPKQFIMELSSLPKSPLSTVLGWLIEGELVDNAKNAREIAEALLRGATDATKTADAQRSLALAYFGYVPVTPSGKVYTLGPEGVRDPDRGSAYAPIWPSLPVQGSAAEALLARFVRFRTELAFDDEPATKGSDPMQSLHVRLSITSPAR